MFFQITNDEINELRVLEESLWREEKRFDSTYMEKLLAPDFFEVGCSGERYSRDETLTMPRQEIDAVLPLPYFEARLVDANTSLVTYRSSFNYAGNVETGHRVSVWSRVSGNWLLLFHQVTPA